MDTDMPGGVGLPSPADALVCLLPARNAVEDLAGYLETVAALDASVVALDDGSVDETAELLAASPLVTRLLRNPQREGFAGWDDAENRRRLLVAARDLEPDWVLFLDADERIDADDARALRAFLAGDALPGLAYGLELYRTWGDLVVAAPTQVYRLFAPMADPTFPTRRLHFNPVPAQIPRSAWLPTTIRARHLDSPERLGRRTRKYVEVDPDGRFAQPSRRLMDPPDASGLVSWWRRPDGLGALDVESARPGAGREAQDLAAPVLSAIVISRNDERTIERSLRSVLEQDCPVPFEVIVAVSGTDRTAALVADRFPGVTLVELGARALPGRARNAGLAVARGEYVSFPGSHVELPPGSLAARVQAHEDGATMVTGSIVNGTRTRSGWASYFIDHSSALPGRPSGPLGGAPAHCSYVRQFLDEAGGFPEDLRAGEDTAVNRELWRRGHRAWRERRLRLVHHSPCSSPTRLVRHHFVRGRAFGRVVIAGGLESDPDGPRWPGTHRLAPGVRGYGRRRLAATDRRVADWGAELRSEYRHARPLVVLGIAAAWAGMWLELLRSGRSYAQLGVGARLWSAERVDTLRAFYQRRRAASAPIPNGRYPDELPVWCRGHWDRPWTAAAAHAEDFHRWLDEHGYLSPSFTKAEAACRDGTSVDAGGVTWPARAHAFDLERLRHELGGAPIEIISWYRTPGHNRRVGGGPGSEHLRGHATDVARAWVEHIGRERVVRAAEAVFANGGLGVYPAGSMHFDSRGTRARWSGS